MDRQTNIKIGNVVRTFCSLDHFMKKIAPDYKKVCWIITPPRDYQISLREILDQSVQRMREVVMSPVINPKTGKLNYHTIDRILKIVAMLEPRVKGAVVQKHLIAQRNVNFNVNAGSTSTEDLSMEALQGMEKRIDYLKSKTERLQIEEGENGGETIEGEFSEEGTPSRD